jgi:hypothetical protein
MEILALLLAELMKVAVIFLRQVWKWWQESASTLILPQRIILTEMVYGFSPNGKNVSCRFYVLREPKYRECSVLHPIMMPRVKGKSTYKVELFIKVC